MIDRNKLMEEFDNEFVSEQTGRWLEEFISQSDFETIPAIKNFWIKRLEEQEARHREKINNLNGYISELKDEIEVLEAKLSFVTH